MSFQPSRLGRGEWIVGAGSAVLLASMLLLPFYGGAQTVDGWNGLTRFRWLVVVTLVLAGALLVFQASRRAPAVPVTIALFVAIFGALTTAWLIYRVGISPPRGRKVGGWVALAGAVTITYGAGSSMRREGIAAKDAPAAIPTADPWADTRS